MNQTDAVAPLGNRMMAITHVTCCVAQTSGKAAVIACVALGTGEIVRAPR